MAGSERSGFEYSSDHLLENAYYILTPGGQVPLEKITEFSELIDSLGSIPMVLTCEEHDFITAGVSHLPHIIVSTLVNLVRELDNDAEYMKTIAAGGFRDITRIASSSPVMWEQICLENHENISHVLDEYIKMLIQARCSVDNLEQKLSMICLQIPEITVTPSTQLLPALSTRPMFFILILSMEAGGIATIATILAMEGISIKNIGIIHNRDLSRVS